MGNEEKWWRHPILLYPRSFLRGCVTHQCRVVCVTKQQERDLSILKKDWVSNYAATWIWTLRKGSLMCIIKRQGLGTTSSFYNSTYFLKLKHEMLIPPSYLNKGRTFTNNLHRCKRCDLGIKAIFLIHKLNSNPGFK